MSTGWRFPVARGFRAAKVSRGQRGGVGGRVRSRRGAWLPGRGYGLIARPVSQGRGRARQGKLGVPDHGAAAFVPLVVEQAATADRVVAKTDVGVIKIEIAGAVLHVATDCSLTVRRPWWRLKRAL